MINTTSEKTAFTVSRLNTSLGIIRVTGMWQPPTLTMTQAELLILTLDIMGTDGWVALNITLPDTLIFINKLNHEILLHLYTR
ncbi:hypothetical protein N9E78_00775 [bacterium]|nr:hypothetical protein [bacterium]